MRTGQVRGPRVLRVPRFGSAVRGTLAVAIGLVGLGGPGSGGSARAGTLGGGREAFGSAIVVGGREVEIGWPVVLWNDEGGLDGYATECAGGNEGGCCENPSRRYGDRRGVARRSRAELEAVIRQVVLHMDGCTSSRACFASMHARPRPDGGCGLSAHFMIDADGTIFQTLDLAERAFHAEAANNGSIGIELSNRGRVDESELDRLPADYRERPRVKVRAHGEEHLAFAYRDEQYAALDALLGALLKAFPLIRPIVPTVGEATGRRDEPLLVAETTIDRPQEFAGILGHLHVDGQKWDPGALDWKRVVDGVRGFVVPIVGARVSGRRARGARGTRTTETARTSVGGAREGQPMAMTIEARPGDPVRAMGLGELLAVQGRGPRGHDGDRDGGGWALFRHEVGPRGEAIFALVNGVVFERAPWVGELGERERERLLEGQVVNVSRRVSKGEIVGRAEGRTVSVETFSKGVLRGGFKVVVRPPAGEMAARRRLAWRRELGADKEGEGMGGGRRGRWYWYHPGTVLMGGR